MAGDLLVHRRAGGIVSPLSDERGITEQAERRADGERFRILSDASVWPIADDTGTARVLQV